MNGHRHLAAVISPSSADRPAHLAHLFWLLPAVAGCALSVIGVVLTVRIRPRADRARDHLLGPLFIAIGIAVTGVGLWELL